MKQISLRLPDELGDAIDDARGQIPRERWIKNTLGTALGLGPPYEGAVPISAPDPDIVTAATELAAHKPTKRTISPTAAAHQARSNADKARRAKPRKAGS